jgi:hypothetical protein
MGIKQFYQRLFKTPPLRNTRVVETPAYRSFSTPAQIAAYADARFDRLRWLNGDATEQHIPEPGLRGLLDAVRERISNEPGANFELTTPNRLRERREWATRIRDGQ